MIASQNVSNEDVSSSASDTSEVPMICTLEESRRNARLCYDQMKNLDTRFFHLLPLRRKLWCFEVSFVDNSCKDFFNGVSIAHSPYTGKFEIILTKDGELVYFGAIGYTSACEFNAVESVIQEVVWLEFMTLNEFRSYV
jgi:hypothetical protein